MKKLYGAGILAGALIFIANMAMACDVNCSDPVAVGKGVKVPIHTVQYCIVGPADGDYEMISCQDPRAVHKTPTGNDGVCFVDENGRPGWDFQSVVREGRKFFVHKIKGVWYPHWL